MGIWANGRLASIAAALFLIWAAIPAQAACVGSGCATAAATSGRTDERASKPVVLNKFTKRSAKHAAASKAIQKKYATKRAAKYARVAAKVQKAGRKFTVAAVNPKSVAAESLKPSVADARAEMSESDIRAASLLAGNPASGDAQPPEAIEVASADQLNDIDRAASADTPAPKTIAQKTTAPPISSGQVQVTASSADTWDQTSLIGKIFVAFGGLLTLASAARLFIA